MSDYQQRWDLYAAAAITGLLAWSHPRYEPWAAAPDGLFEHAAYIADRMMLESAQRNKEHT